MFATFQFISTSSRSFSLAGPAVQTLEGPTPRPARLALVDSMVAWLRPVGVQRDTRAPGRLAHSPSWLTVAD